MISSCTNETKNKKSNTKKSHPFESMLNTHIIPVSHGIKLKQEYVSKRTEPLEPLLKEIYNDSMFVDTEFIHFSLEDMKNYVNFLEHIQAENTDKEVSGIRIYFGAYENMPRMDGRPVKYPKQQTVFMVPTVNIGKVNTDFDNLNHLPFYVEGTIENPYKGKFLIIDDLMLNYNKEERLNMANQKTTSQKAFIGSSVETKSPLQQNIITSTVFNEGEMSPPPLPPKE